MWEIAETFWQFNKKIFQLTSPGTKCYIYISNTIYWTVSADASIIVMQYSAIKYLKIFYICFAPDFSTSDTLKSVQLFTVDWLHLQKHSLNLYPMYIKYTYYLYRYRDIVYLCDIEGYITLLKF